MPLGIKHQPSVLTPDGIELDRGGVGGGTTPKWPAHDQRRGQKAFSRGQKSPGFQPLRRFAFRAVFFSASGSGSIFGALSSGKMESKVGSQRGGE